MKRICYHYCKNEFVQELVEKGEIQANKYIKPNVEMLLPEDYVKDYVFNKRNINAGHGMFFAWSNPAYKGKIQYDEHGEYSLIKFEIDDKICVKTNYENWGSLGVDIYEADGDLELADVYCKEYGFINGLQGSYESIYDIYDTSMEIQILLPYLKAEWIKSIKKVKQRYI